LCKGERSERGRQKPSFLFFAFFTSEAIPSFGCTEEGGVTMANSSFSLSIKGFSMVSWEGPWLFVCQWTVLRGKERILFDLALVYAVVTNKGVQKNWA